MDVCHTRYSGDGIPRNSLGENTIIQQIRVKKARSQGEYPLVFKLAQRASFFGVSGLSASCELTHLTAICGYSCLAPVSCLAYRENYTTIKCSSVALILPCVPRIDSSKPKTSLEQIAQALNQLQR